LRLKTWGVEKTSNDDGCSLQSTMTYTPTASDTFYVCAGCKNALTCSGTITISPVPSNGCPP
jgi:hypothetical protein